MSVTSCLRSSTTLNAYNSRTRYDINMKISWTLWHYQHTWRETTTFNLWGHLIHEKNLTVCKKRIVKIWLWSFFCKTLPCFAPINGYRSCLGIYISLNFTENIYYDIYIFRAILMNLLGHANLVLKMKYCKVTTIKIVFRVRKWSVI